MRVLLKSEKKNKLSQLHHSNTNPIPLFIWTTKIQNIVPLLFPDVGFTYMKPHFNHEKRSHH